LAHHYTITQGGKEKINRIEEGERWQKIENKKKKPTLIEETEVKRSRRN